MRSLKTAELAIDSLTAHPLSLEIFGELEDHRIIDLQSDIEDRGLQYPLEVDNQNRVICGSQRLKAITALGWDTAPCLVRDDLQTEDEIRAHLLKDNVFRRQLTPGQMAKAGRELERIYGAQAKQRMVEGGQHKPLENTEDSFTPLVEPSPIHTIDRVAADLGTSPTTYGRIKTIYDKGDAQLQHEVDIGVKSISAAAEEIRKGEETFQATEMPSDDGRRQAIRYGKLRRQLEKYEDYLDKADFKEFADEPRWKDNLVYSLHDLQKIIQSKLEQLI